MAAAPAFRATGVQLTSLAATPVVASTQGIWADAATTKNLRFDDGTNSNFVAAIPATTKGDIAVFNGTNWLRLGVGSNTQVLTADSTQASGIKWAPGGAGSATLASAYAAGASQTDSTLALDSTRLGLRVFDNATPISGDLFRIANSGNTVTYFAVNASGQQLLRSGAASGGVAISLDTLNTFASGTLFRVTNNGTQKFSLDFAGNVNMVAGTSIAAAGALTVASTAGTLQLTGSTAISLSTSAVNLSANVAITAGSAATNTVGLKITSNVADGASSVGVAIDNTTAMTSGKILSLRNAGTEYFAASYNGTFSTIQGTSTNTRFIGLGGAGVADQSGTCYLYSNNTVCAQIISSNYIAPFSDASLSSGATGLNWASNWSYRYITASQIFAAATSITVNPANGDYVRVNLSGTAFTTGSISAGNNGEEMIVELAQDATGSRATPTTWTGVAFQGGLAPVTTSTGANKRDTFTLVFNSTLNKWVETGRSTNIS